MYSLRISGVLRPVVLAACVAVLAACGGPEARKAEALEAGQKFLAEGNLDKARIEMRNVLQIDPNDAEARFMSGVIAERLDNMRQAAGHYRATLDIDAGHTKARASLSRIYVMAGLPNDAIGLVEEVLAEKEGAERAPLLAVRGAAYSQLGMVEEALLDARNAVAADPNHEQGVALLGGVLTNREEYTEAAQVLDDGIANSPESMDLRVARALLAEQMGDAAAAVDQYNYLLEANPEEVVYRYQAAAYYQRANEIDKAEAALRDAVEIAGDDAATLRLVSFIEQRYGADAAEQELRERSADSASTRLQLANFYRRQDRIEDAMTTYRSLVDDMPRAPEADTAKARLAALLLERGEREQAVGLLEGVLEENPRNADALFVRATQAVTENRPDDAIADFRLLIRDDPEVIVNHLGIARAYLLKGQNTLAEEALRDAVKAEPNNLESRVQLAQFLARNGKTEAADDLIRSVIVRAPESIIARDTAVRIAITRGDWSEALERAKGIVEIAPDAYAGHYLSGIALEGLKDEPAAIEAYERAIDLNVDAADALVAWARIKVRNGEIEPVFAAIDRVPETSAARVTVDHLKGEVLMTQGEAEQSRAVLESVIERNSAWWVPYRTLSRTYAAEDLDNRTAALQRGFDATNAPLPLGIELATLYEQQGRIDAAIGTYDAMIEANAASDLLANNLAMLLATYRTDAASLERAQQLTQQFASTDNPAFLNTFGWTRLKSGQLDVALPALKQAVNLQPNSAILRYHLGVALAETGDSDAAREELSRALQLGDQFPGADDARERLSSI